MSEQTHDRAPGSGPSGLGEPAEAVSRPWCVLAVAVLIVAVTAAVYLNSFRGEFVLDDNLHIVRSRWIRQLWPVGPVLKHTRPVVNLSLAVNYRLGRLKVGGYHAFNLLVHLVAALALFGVVRRTLLSERLRGRFGQTSLPLALAAAAIWAVHPLQTGSVTYLIQRAESMMGMFYLLALYCAIRGFAAPRPMLWYAAAVLCCGLGMGSKEVMVTAPLVVLLYDRIFAAGSLRQILRWRWGLYAGLAATWLVLLVRLTTGPATSGAGYDMPVSGRWEYAATQFGVILHYLRLSVWPHRLCLDPAWLPATTVGRILPQALVVAALLVATGLALWRRPALGFLGAWFFVILAPTSSIMPIADRMFEHRMYLSLAAVVVLLVVGGYALGRRLLARVSPGPALGWVLGVLGAAVVVALLGLLTVRRNRLYGDVVKMYADVVDQAPHNPRAHRNLGVALAERGVAMRDPAWLYRSLEHLTKAIDLTVGKAHKAKACNNYGASLEQLSLMVKDSSKYEAQAVEQYERAIALDDNCSDAHQNLAGLLARRAWRAKTAGRPYRQTFDRALRHFEKAMTLTPRRSGPYLSCGTALAQMGHPALAVKYLQKASELRPADAGIRYNLALALWDAGRDAEAVSQFRQAVRLGPGMLPAAHALARALATSSDAAVRDGGEAVRLAEHVCRNVSRPGAHHLDTLAAAYAEAGRFKEAILAIQPAIQMARKAGRTRELAGFRARLALYRAGRPYHRPRRAFATTRPD